MKIHKRFPITDFVEVSVGESVLKVRYKFPTIGQAKALADESSIGGHAMAVCQFCIDELQGLESEDGPVMIKASMTRRGEELSEEQVLVLYNNGMTIPLYAYYAQNLAPKESDKKKSESSQAQSTQGNQ